MSAETVTALTGAFSPTALVSTFTSMAPYIMTVVGVVVGVGLIKWGIRKARQTLSKGVA